MLKYLRGGIFPTPWVLYIAYLLIKIIVNEQAIEFRLGRQFLLSNKQHFEYAHCLMLKEMIKFCQQKRVLE